MSDRPPVTPLTHPVGVLYEIRWQEICPWLILVKALRVTLLVRVLILAFVGVLLTQWGMATIDRFFSTEGPVLQQFVEASPTNDLVMRPSGIELSDTEQPYSIVLASKSLSPFLRGWYQLTKPFLQLANLELSWQSSLRLLIHGLWTIVIWAIFGGAIARIAALYLTRGETLSPSVALRDAITVWPGTTGAPLIALLATVALAVPLVLLGFLIRLNFMALVAGLLWWAVLAWGLMLSVVLLGLLFGWPLMWGCLGVERSDAFDGVSRCYAYVYQRPLQLLFYIVVAALLALLGEVVVNVFATVTVALAEWTLSWGSGSARVTELVDAEWQTSVSPVATRMIQGWKWGLDSVVAAFPMACFWPMSVGIYLLLRRHVDATEMDEITLSDGAIGPGLPGLEAKASGVPEMKQPDGNDE